MWTYSTSIVAIFESISIFLVSMTSFSAPINTVIVGQKSRLEAMTRKSEKF